MSSRRQCLCFAALCCVVLCAACRSTTHPVLRRPLAHDASTATAQPGTASVAMADGSVVAPPDASGDITAASPTRQAGARGDAARPESLEGSLLASAALDAVAHRDDPSGRPHTRIEFRYDCTRSPQHGDCETLRRGFEHALTGWTVACIAPPACLAPGLSDGRFFRAVIADVHETCRRDDPSDPSQGHALRCWWAGSGHRFELRARGAQLELIEREIDESLPESIERRRVRLPVGPSARTPIR